MEIALFIFYLVFFVFIISRIPFFSKSGISTPCLIGLFSIKIMAGFAYAKFYRLPQYYAGADTWRFYHLSLKETDWLLHNPIAFFKDLFIYGYSDTGNLFSSENTYWNDLKSNVPVKVMAITNVFTHNSYYTNIIFFNFLFLFGLVALFKLFNILFPKKKNRIIVGVFLLPSTLFWCSGIHKDGLILSATGILIYNFYHTLVHGLSAKRIALMLLCLLLIFSLRNYIVFALLPALFSWWLSNKYPLKKNTVFAGVYLIGILAFFFIPIILPSVNLPLFITEKRQEFLLLQGNSVVSTQPLQATFAGFIYFLPRALDMAFLRPHLTEIKNTTYIPAAAETAGIILLVIISLFTPRHQKLQPAILALFCFTVSVLLLCGYTIPFTGAIVRYKSLVLPMLVTPLLCIVELRLTSHKPLL